MNKQSKRLIIILPALLTIGCVNQTYYSEPVDGKTATIYLKKDSIGASALKSLVYIPTYGMSIINVDGRRNKDMWGKGMLKVSSGPHDILISCSINGRLIGTKSFKINAVSGKTYTITFPPEIKGYVYLTTACNMLKIQ